MKRYRVEPRIESGSLLQGMIIGVQLVESPTGGIVEFTDHQAEIAKFRDLLKRIRQPLIDGEDVPCLVQEIDDLLAQNPTNAMQHEKM